VINIVATIGDVQHLPYPAASFDGAYLIDALGEMPNPPAVLRELRRVLKPAARLVVGEHFVDPDFTSLGRLKDQAREAGFRFERRTGPIVVYLSLWRFSTATVGHDSVTRSYGLRVAVHGASCHRDLRG